MNNDQWEKFKAAIESDCGSMYRYRDVYGTTCAIGGLIKYAGYEHLLDRLDGALNRVSIRSGDAVIAEMRHVIVLTYGLDESVLRMIQIINDDHTYAEARRRAILDYVYAYYSLEEGK